MDRQQQILTISSAFVLGISIGRWLRQFREHWRERLHSSVARSGQWRAALRAVESLEIDGSLFKDELASVLAGKRAFSRALREAMVRWSPIVREMSCPRRCVVVNECCGDDEYYIY